MISSVKLEVLSDGKLICEKILTLPLDLVAGVIDETIYIIVSGRGSQVADVFLNGLVVEV